jgi:solute carrier family 25 iron transporter 28/37
MNEQIEEVDLEWEEWDGNSPYLHHCIAGSIAGVAEHVLLYPVDTVKTHMQAYCSVCPNNPENMASNNPSTKAVCTGPPASVPSSSAQSLASTVYRNGTAAAAGASTSTSTAATSSSSTHAPNGMWTTMSNLINHGHSFNHQLKKNVARQSATLSASSISLSPNSASSSPSSSTTPSIQHFKNFKGYTRLWRGVQTMATGCIPAHALYFSSYEYTKSVLSTTTTSPTTGLTQTHLGTFGASIAGAISALCHDIVMTPMDTIKQRMQLGHYDSMAHAFRQIIQLEGWGGLYRSFNVTVMTNLPYGMIMVSTNEFLRGMLLDMKQQPLNGKPVRLDLQTTMIAGCGAGMVASAITAPLDRVKTRLQTQRMLHVFPMNTAVVSTNAKNAAQKPMACPKASAIVKASMEVQPHYSGFNDAFFSIVKEEGYIGLWRGLAPRLLTHTPAVAISWTAYEAAKKFLHDNL